MSVIGCNGQEQSSISIFIACVDQIFCYSAHLPQLCNRTLSCCFIQGIRYIVGEAMLSIHQISVLSNHLVTCHFVFPCILVTFVWVQYNVTERGVKHRHIPSHYFIMYTWRYDLSPTSHVFIRPLLACCCLVSVVGSHMKHERNARTNKYQQFVLNNKSSDS